MLLYPSNGVPWLVWLNNSTRWQCQACGASGAIPSLSARGVLAFTRALGDLKRRHCRCRPHGCEQHEPGIGHPLNPDRIVR